MKHANGSRVLLHFLAPKWFFFAWKFNFYVGAFPDILVFYALTMVDEEAWNLIQVFCSSFCLVGGGQYFACHIKYLFILLSVEWGGQYFAWHTPEAICDGGKQQQTDKIADHPSTNAPLLGHLTAQTFSTKASARAPVLAPNFWLGGQPQNWPLSLRPC